MEEEVLNYKNFVAAEWETCGDLHDPGWDLAVDSDPSSAHPGYIWFLYVITYRKAIIVSSYLNGPNRCFPR